MSKSTTTVEGWIANELQVRDAQGHRVVDVSVPVTPQKLVDGKWQDSGETIWYRASFWDERGDAVLDRVNKGHLVQITGTLKIEAWSSGDKSGTRVVLTFPTMSVVIAPPAKNALPARSEQPAPVAAAQDDAWPAPKDSQEPAYDYSNEQPF